MAELRQSEEFILREGLEYAKKRIRLTSISDARDKARKASSFLGPYTALNLVWPVDGGIGEDEWVS